jgi:hypothetical protein
LAARCAGPATAATLGGVHQPDHSLHRAGHLHVPVGP